MALINTQERSSARSVAGDSLAEVAVLIPARRFEPGLSPLVKALSESGFGAVLIVDDGMSSDERSAFERLAELPHIHLLHHAVNLGKGRALKTGMNYFLTELTKFTELVTADADGQHSLEDIIRVARAALKRPAAVVLGCRRFGNDVPLRSRFGNTLTRYVFSFLSGREVVDTQTGLRVFPAAILPQVLALPGERYEYEMTVLAHLSRRGAELIEVPIATIYIEDNRSSHFNPVRDSMRIYFMLMRFYASSLISAGLDLAFFTLTFWATGHTQ
jgi:glycosyltransferase involved in cell wall biosynthesis